MEQRPRFRPHLEALEDRWLPNNFFSPGSGLGANLFDGKHLDSPDEALFVAALSASQPHSHGNQGNPGVLPPQSHSFGQTYGEWEASFWQWA